MHDRCFDALARTLAATRSRRRALGLLAGGALGGAMALLGRGEAAAACGTVGQPCDATRRCCPGAACADNGRCRCKPGLTDCGGRCRNLQTDENNCGKCGRVCAAGRTCCAGRCVNTANAEAHCGKCGKACRADQICVGGTCLCPNGTVPCQNACVAACPNGQPPDATTCQCAGACTCPLKAEGEPCADNAECCSARCAGGSCQMAEPGSAPVGHFCANDESGDNECWTGLCEGCQCICVATAGACPGGFRECCSGNCFQDRCCNGVDEPCAGNADCCSGVCSGGLCACAPGGKVVRGGFDCCSNCSFTEWIDPDNGIGRQRCCYDGGAVCHENGECADGCCANGVCNSAGCPPAPPTCPPDPCPNGEVRDVNTCQCRGCPNGFPPCNGRCVNYLTDDQNCGVCGNPCLPTANCQNGNCLI